MKKLLILLLVFASSATAQYEVSITSIPVWVKVVDRDGKPITGLTEQDFELFEDGKRMPTDCFEEIRLDQQPAASTEAAGATPTQPPPPQKFVLFLDLYNTTPREYAAVKPALQNFVDGLGSKNSTPQILLAALMPDRRLGIISRYTSDFNRVRILLDFAKANPRRDVQAKERADAMKEALTVTQGANERTTMVEDNVVDGYHVAQIIAAEEADTSRHTLGALESLAEYMSRLESKDHTTVIFVSGGFPADPGRRFFNMVDAFDSRGSQDAATLVGSSNRQTGFFFQEELQKAVGTLNRMNVTLYTLDTRGASSEKEYQDSLVQIAQETGGLAFFNSNNFAVGLERVSEDIQHQYIICYRPPEHKSIGSYHSIRVNVKRSGANIRHREGYWE